MGCTGSSSEFGPEEAYLFEAQEALGFSKHKASYIDTIIRKYSSHQLINKCQLEAIQEELEIHTCNYDTFHCITEVFERLRGQGGLKLKLFLTLGLLAGQGSTKSKAALLFEVYDDAYMGELSDKDMSQLVSDLIFVIVECLGCLSNQMTVASYIAQVRKSSERYKEFIKNCVMISDPCTKQGFIEGWKNLKPLSLSPEAMRISMYQQATRDGVHSLKANALSQYIHINPKAKMPLTPMRPMKRKPSASSSNPEVASSDNKNAESQRIE